MTKIAIFDYGAGNIFSLKNALERQNAVVEVHTDVNQLKGFDGVFLPGVGNFDPAIQSIKKDYVNFDEIIGNTPVFGICLGMEMFFEKSQEGIERGLGIIDGNVIVLPSTLKVPHMGWNSINIRKSSILLDGIEDGSWVYFVHSYRANPANDDVIVAESEYDIKVPAIVEKQNYFGTQFHPEKSGSVGAKMLENFLKVCSK